MHFRDAATTGLRRLRSSPVRKQRSFARRHGERVNSTENRPIISVLNVSTVFGFTHATDQLAALFGSGVRRSLHPLVASNWSRMTYVGGAYSHALPGHAAARRDLARPFEHRLFFAGEATHANDFSTAHGAHDAGVRAAEEVIAALVPHPAWEFCGLRLAPSRGPGNGILRAETGGRIQVQNAGERPEFGSQTATRLTNRPKLRGFLQTRKPRRFAGTTWWRNAVSRNRSPSGKFPGVREFCREFTRKPPFALSRGRVKHRKLRTNLCDRPQIPYWPGQGIAGN